MTEPKQENSFLSAVERILMIVTIFILSPVALIHDCSGGKPFEFTSGKQIETSGTDVFGGSDAPETDGKTNQPKGKTVREYLMLELPKKYRTEEIITYYEAESQRYLDKGLKEVQKPEDFHLIVRSQKYLSKAARKIVEPKIEAKGRKLDDEYFIPVLDINGKVFIDTRKFHEEIWMSLTAAELMMEANQEYYQRTMKVDLKTHEIIEPGDQFVFAAGARSPERQAISQALWNTSCEAQFINKLKKFLGIKLKCEKAMKSEVGSCYGTAHHPGFAVDMDYGKMKNAKLAREILAKKGFLVYCPIDKPHVDWSKKECW